MKEKLPTYGELVVALKAQLSGLREVENVSLVEPSLMHATFVATKEILESTLIRLGFINP